MVRHRRSVKMRRGSRICTAALSLLIGLQPSRPVRGTLTPTAFAIVGSQFHIRDPDDTGEVRICLQNTGTISLSMAQLQVQIMSERHGSSDEARSEHKYLYARLSPPILRPREYGQLVAKLVDRPAKGPALTCTVSATGRVVSHAVSLTEPALWISYVGLSQDLRTIFVYVENHSDEAVMAGSLQIGNTKRADPVAFINRLIPPNDKGCLVRRLPLALTEGEFIPVAVSARKDDQDIHVHSVVRAINKLPLMMVESGTPDPDLGLDMEGFTETMVCIAHAHGTHEQAANKFLEGYGQWFHRDPREMIQLDMCRSDSPRAWFRFGSLPDVGRMNPVLRPPPIYDKKDHRQWFNPFFYRGHLAKKAVEPCRYVAVMPIVPEEGLFLQRELTPQEVKFLAYCALASGAKGLAYRGRLANDPLNRNSFVRLNRELRPIEPLLLIGEPVEWATTRNDNWVVKSLLCGDQAILLMVFDRRYFSQQKNGKFYTPPFGKVVTQARIDVRVPGELSVGQVRTLFAPLERGAWTYRESYLSFTVDMIDSVQVYLIDLQHQAKSSEAGGLAL